MTTCEEIEPRLSEYVDGDVDASTRAGVAAHLASCERCAGVAVDFERLRSAASNLGPIAPPPGAWASIVARVEVESDAPRRSSAARATWPGLAAAAAIVLVAGGAYVVHQARQSAAAAAVATSAAAAPTSLNDELTQAMQHYDTAIADLQATATSGEHQLDPAVAATLKRNLGVIDDAIAESRTAVTVDPTSAAARDSLFDALQQKVTVLQDTVALITDAREPDSPARGSQR
jgi:anti-sigma factor RsiW